MILELEPLGEAAVRFAIPREVDRGALIAALRALEGVIDAHASETHACARFDPARPLDASRIAAALKARASARAPRRTHVLEVIYDGPDLDEVAALTGLATSEIAERHARGEYEVSFLGFLPGFGYLRGLDDALAAIPRRDAPRARVPAGSVAIAGGFTAVYPWASPGGWRILGRVPRFEPLDGEHVRLAIGDRVRFERVG